MTVDAVSYGELTDPPQSSYVCLNVLGYKFVFVRTSAAACRKIRWAGNPKEVHVSEVLPSITMPRRSFDTYVEHVSNNPPPFTKRDTAMFEAAVRHLTPIIHQIRLARVQQAALEAKKESELVNTESAENYALFTTMSHELRTPLYAITGTLDIINELGHDKMDDVKHYAGIGLDVCTDMMKTLNDLLQVLKTTHRLETIDTSELTVDDIFHSTSSGLEIFAETNGIHFCTTYDCNPQLLVQLDVKLTANIFNNLCGNAIKFSNTGGTVDARISVVDSESSVGEYWTNACKKYQRFHIATSNDNLDDKDNTSRAYNWLVLQVQDNGRGIDGANMPKIFQRFLQVEDVVTKKFGSTGLGLHITLAIINKLHGFMAVASTFGEGTLFFCAFPVEKLQPRRKSLLAAEGTMSTAAALVKNADASFLVVDDSKVNVMIAQKQISNYFVKATIHTATNGKAAIEELESMGTCGVKVSGILMDYHMSVMCGVEATRQIRKTDRDVPIAMLTADITEMSRQSMLLSGVNFIVLEPSRPAEIIKTCVQMINLRLTKSPRLPPITNTVCKRKPGMNSLTVDSGGERTTRGLSC